MLSVIITLIFKLFFINTKNGIVFENNFLKYPNLISVKNGGSHLGGNEIASLYVLNDAESTQRNGAIIKNAIPNMIIVSRIWLTFIVFPNKCIFLFIMYPPLASYKLKYCYDTNKNQKHN